MSITEQKSGFLRRKLVDPLIALLKQGVTPQKLAWSLSLGVTIACIPVLGATTVLCAWAAHVFRLNHIAIQIANYAAYPLQFALLIPFFRMGEWIFGVEPLELSIPEMMAAFQEDAGQFFTEFGMVGARGAFAWLCVAPFAAMVLYFVFLPLMRLLKR